MEQATNKRNRTELAPIVLGAVFAIMYMPIYCIGILTWVIGKFISAIGAFIMLNKHTAINQLTEIFKKDVRDI